MHFLSPPVRSATAHDLHNPIPSIHRSSFPPITLLALSIQCFSDLVLVPHSLFPSEVLSLCSALSIQASFFLQRQVNSYKIAIYIAVVFHPDQYGSLQLQLHHFFRKRLGFYFSAFGRGALLSTVRCCRCCPSMRKILKIDLRDGSVASGRWPVHHQRRLGAGPTYDFWRIASYPGYTIDQDHTSASYRGYTLLAVVGRRGRLH